MTKMQFQAESKRLLDMMIHSIYSHKEIFLRELISNASDAIDKIYYRALTDESLTFNKEEYYVKITPNKATRTLTITDTGIGMTREELENNLGTIAKSGSLAFKSENEAKEDFNIIGQFGVGFYSAFMVADRIIVETRALGSDESFKWESEGADGYTIESATKAENGTTITLFMKENTEDENFDRFLEFSELRNLVKKYSDFIRYPIKMDETKRSLKEGTENEYDEYVEEVTVNSMVPIWRKNRNELTEEDYNNFYHEKHFGFDTPLQHMHVSVEGNIRYNAILYVPSQAAYDYYTKDFKKGLELYSNGVLIMNKCEDLLPDYFSFVKGMVDSEDLSLNISREILQQDRQLQLIAKNIKNKIKKELQALLKNEREKYETFFNSFGKQLKYGLYSDFGADKKDLQDLVLFVSSYEKKLVSLAEYVERMPEEQKYIYYATGESVERIDRLPQTEAVREAGYEILYFTDEIDEFAINMLMNYNDKAFKSVSSGDLELPEKEESNEETKRAAEENKELFATMKDMLGVKVSDVRLSKRLKSHPVCLTAEGEISIEMEKVLRAMPNNEGIQAEKVLEINPNHDVFKALQDAYANDREKLALYTSLLFNQALLIEGLTIEDPVAFTNDICKVMA